MPKNKLFFNLNDPTQGICRELAPGLSTRIFPGDQAMLSVVTLAANAEGVLHTHPEEQWGVMLEAAGSGPRAARRFLSKLAISGGPRAIWHTP